MYADFSAHHLPDLFNYVVPILNGKKELGSGVLVNYQGRHLVATARHCIECKPRPFLPLSRIEQYKAVSTRQLVVLQVELHSTLDIEYMEIEAPEVGELSAGQFCKEHVAGGMVHIIGYPSMMAQVDWPNKNVSVCGGAFSTTLIEAADDFLKFDYPRQGSKPDPVTGNWMPSMFPASPKGFSGGGCFGVVNRAVGSIRVVEYKLLGIQSSWSEDGRWVKVIPIKRLSEMLSRHERQVQGGRSAGGAGSAGPI